jgi:hypothetical protein
MGGMPMDDLLSAFFQNQGRRSADPFSHFGGHSGFHSHSQGFPGNYYYDE